MSSMKQMHFLVRSLAAVIAIAASQSGAQTAGAPGSSDTAGSDDYHRQASDDIIVTAPFRRERSDVLAGTSVLQGAALTQALRPTIGETLNSTPGVSSTSFGPNASRPVLRGLQGERVRVLTDGIGSIDVSNTSVDHAVAIDPLLAERVEVLRGPSALLYGSEAIGGVVNVLDKRIPRKIPDEPIHVDGILTYGSASRERSGGVAVDAPVGERFVVHADGSYLKTDDLRIGGHVLTPALRSAARAASQLPPDDGAEPIDFAASAALEDKLPNSAGRTWSAGVGAALITGGGSFGISYGRYDSLYGVPVRYATAPGQEQEAPRLDLKQDRFDARIEVQSGGLLSAVRGRFGYAKYRHFELEEDGSVGTAFYNKGLEGRLELVQADHGAWKGASGVQYFARSFNVVGDEAFLPRNDTQQIGFFILQQLDLDAFKAEAGARFEHSTLLASPTAGQGFFSGRRSFDAFSASAGASWGFVPGWRIGANLSRTVRAPSAEELFANGPHAGTEAYEIGDPAFKTERSWGVEAILHGKGADYSIEASAYHNWFDNFIYEDLTGDIEDGLPVYRSYQARARYYGFELKGALTLARFGATELSAEGLADYVHATILDVGPAPRIPPLRLLGALAAHTPKLDGRIELEWTDAQRRTALGETSTDGFTLVNASLDARPWGEDSPVTFALSANNILDVTARRHASFLKDYAPLAGRDIRITARFTL